MLDMFDPNNWPPPEPRRIYLDDKGELFCLVDEEDYQWALQWLWSATPNSTGRKFYATRSTRLSGRAGPQTKIFMHKEILHRARKPQPTEKHTIGDHQDGDSLHNCRSNLEWATHQSNSKNRHGLFARQRALAV
jgi:hypothetical protein